MAPDIKWGHFWAQSLQDFITRGEPQKGSHWGDEWGEPMSNICKPLLERMVLSQIKKGDVAVEIGPGGGRLTRHIRHGLKRLYLVEYNPEFFSVIRQRFNDPENFVYVHSKDGKTMREIKNREVDFVFSWGTFVHFELDHIGAYLKEIKRVLKRNGKCFLQIPDKNRPQHQGAFGNVTLDEFLAMVKKLKGLKVLEVDAETLPNSTCVLLKRSA
jgi:ubiquinone/menaquinone biosynthesis C-methylase UbiE